MLSVHEKYLVKNQKKFALDSASSSSEEDQDYEFKPDLVAKFHLPYALKLA